MMRMKRILAWIFVCVLAVSAITAPASAAETVRYEAEDAQFQKQGLKVEGNALTGFAKNSQAAAVFTVRAASAGTKSVTVNYASAGEGRMAVVVNGTKAEDILISQGDNQATQMQVSLMEGTNQIILWNAYDSIQEELKLFGITAEGVTYGAPGSFYSAGNMTVDGSHAGFSGAGFVAGFYMNKGSHIQFTVNVAEAGEYDVSIGYANGNTEAKGMPAKLAVYVNGSKQTDTLLVPGVQWNTYLKKTEQLKLQKGENTITYWYEDVSVDAAPNIDYIEVGPKGTAIDDTDGTAAAMKVIEDHNNTVVPFTVTPSKAVTLEAEDAHWFTENRYKPVGHDATHSGFTGTGYVAGMWSNPGSGIEFPLEVLVDGTYALSLHYANGAGPANVGIYVDGEKIQQYEVFGSGGWSSWAEFSIDIDLTTSDRKVSVIMEVGEGEYGINLDSVTLTPVLVDAPAEDLVAYLPAEPAADYTLYGIIGIGVLIPVLAVVLILIYKKHTSAPKEKPEKQQCE